MLPLYLNGIDKSFETHIKESKKRDIPVAVYAYVAAKDKKEMEKRQKNSIRQLKNINRHTTG